LDEKQKVRLRKQIHIGFAVLFTLLVFFFKWKDDKSIIDLIFVIAGYTYGPLLGLFSFGILTKRSISSAQIPIVPIVCILAPLLCYALDHYSKQLFGEYKFGNEMLIINGVLTFSMLFLFSKKEANLTQEIAKNGFDLTAPN
jgi:mannitol-specific phosphotransferase system IIBC component